MDIELIFNICNNNFGEKNTILLKKLLEISSPMKFSEDLASDEEIEELIVAMENDDINIILKNKIYNELLLSYPDKGSSNVFI